jgi:hypothetical protein
MDYNGYSEQSDIVLANVDIQAFTAIFMGTDYQVIKD